jgi:hypothetical protein
VGVKGKRLRIQKEIDMDEKETERGNGGSKGNEGTRGEGIFRLWYSELSF